MSGHQREQNASAALFERKLELQAAEQALQRLCGTETEGGPRVGGLLLYNGEAGLGKTALLAETRRKAMVEGKCTVLFARGSESTQAVPFHVVRQLFQPVLAPISEADRKELLAGWYEIAGPALGIVPPIGPQDPQGVRDGIDWLVSQLAARQEPLVAVIDDAHWADAESLTWLAYFAARLAETPLLAVISYRPEELSDAAPVFRDLVGARGNRPVELRALTPDSVSRLVRDAFPEQADAPFCREVWAVTGGNPYETVELIAKAKDRGLKPLEESAPLLRDLGAASRGPGLVARLERLGTAVTRFAWAAAVLGTEIQPSLAANLAGMGPAQAAECADKLRHHRILAGAIDLEFVHPLIATAIYASIPPATRTAMHGQAAWSVTEAGLGAAAASRHLLEVHPDHDSELVEQLRIAAREHLAVGAPDAARRCLERALQEPPPEEERAAVLYELGCSALLTSPPTTVNHLKSALSLPHLTEELRVDATYRLSQAYAHNSQLREAAAVVKEQAERTPPGPGRMRLQAAHYLWQGIQVEEQDSLARSHRIAELAERLPGRDNTERTLRALRGFDGMIRGEDAVQVVEHMTRALVDGRLADGMGWTNTEWGFEVPSIIGITFAYTDRLDQAEELFKEAVTAFEISGWSGGHLAFAHDFLGLVFRRRGELDEAEAMLREGLRLGKRLGPGLPIHWDGACLLIDTLLARGRVDEAQAFAEENGFRAPYTPAIVLPDAASLAGRLLLARGRKKEAIAELEAAGRKLEERGRHNTVWAPWALDLALAVADEDPERARALADKAVRHAAVFGTDTAVGDALRRAALVAEPHEALVKLEKAVVHLRRSPCKYEFAEALVAHGAALLGAGKLPEAAERLREGLEVAGQCAADGLVETARAALASAVCEGVAPAGDTVR
ncbi:AAA family ATPase [Streptomyces roseoverticillatus]|uniref:ATP-binding protein n=1 Tax=Streptomyces roseoverticillatus TaxID=66429 RepID=UPI001F2B99F7|nr:AAA family ATPase [Streptomyces roseoverticillatus]MCF3101595.1 AAA family ATPase [Streptomyces roseoverticillatus]